MRRFEAKQDLKRIFSKGDIFVEAEPKVLKREGHKETDGGLSFDIFEGEFEDWFKVIRKRVTLYCDASYHSDTGAIGAGSMFNLDGDAKNRMFGDFSPALDNNLAEVYAITMSLNHLFSELRDIEFKQGDVDLTIYTDSQEAIRYIEEAAQGNTSRGLANQALFDLRSLGSYTLCHIDSHKENKGPHYMSNCHVDKVAKSAMREVRERIRKGISRQALE